MNKLFIVQLVSCDGYDSWEVSYHLTKKGAYKYIMQRKYSLWQNYGYIPPDSYEDEYMYIREVELNE